MLPITRQISSKNHYKGNTVTYIVLHYTAGPGASAKNHAIYLNRDNAHGSAHYFVDDTSIYQVVEDFNAAWHVGDGKGKYGITNKNSIGIEMCVDKNNQVTATTEANTIELVKHLMKKYGVPESRVIRHYDASRKMCPNWSANNWARWTAFKKKLSGSTSTSSPSTTVTSYKKYADYVGDRCKELQTKLNKLGYNCGKVDGSFGKDTYNALIKFQKENGLDADGYAGTKTFEKLDQLIKKKEENDKLTQGTTMYRVVVGTYSSKKNAEDQQKKLKDKGFNSFLITYEDKLRVVVGTYANKSNAEDQQKKLKAKGFESFLIAIK